MIVIVIIAILVWAGELEDSAKQSQASNGSDVLSHALLRALTAGEQGRRHDRLAAEPAEIVCRQATHFLMFEPANIEAIRAVARHSACARVYLTHKTGEQSAHSLRTMLFEYSRRIFSGMVAVLYREQALGIKLGLELRRDSGVSDPGYDFEEDPDKVPCAVNFAKLVADGLSPRCATRSAFVGPRIFRRIVRAGLPLVEVDQCNAVLAAQLSRHPGAQRLREYVQDRRKFLQTTGCSEKQAKQLYTGFVNGGGKTHFDKWEKATGQKASPFARAFMQEQRELRKADDAAHPELLKRIADLGLSTPASILLQVVLNGLTERQQTDKMDEVTPGRGRTVSIEHDGLVVLLEDADDFEAECDELLADVRAAGVNASLKRYDDIETVLSDLKEMYPLLDWSIVDNDWEQQKADRLELIRRLLQGQTGMDTLLRHLVPSFPLADVDGQALTVRDVFKSVSGGKDIDVCIFDYQNSRRWELTPGLVAVEMLSDFVSKAIVRVLPSSWRGDPPLWCRQGASMRAAAAGLTRSRLYDSSFFRGIDAASTLQVIMFKDGVVLDRDTHATRLAIPADLISHCLGIKYPAVEFAKFERMVGKQLREVLEGVKAIESLQGAAYVGADPFSNQTKMHLDATIGQFGAVKFLFSCFEDWIVVLFVLKQAARKLTARTQYEEILLHQGIGKNGKGVWTEMLRKLFGTYVSNPPLKMLCSALGGSDKPNPSLVALRGRRFLPITEMEATSRLNSGTMKLLRDPASVLEARNLYRDSIEFQPVAGIEIASNVKVNFTTMDGGVRRSLTALTWPFCFVRAVVRENERPVDVTLKQTVRVEQMLPGLCYVLLTIDRVFTSTWGDTVVGPRPLAVQVATREATRSDHLSSLEGFLAEKTLGTRIATEAATELELLKAFMAYATELTKKEAREVLEADLVKKAVGGRRVLATAAMTRGEYIELR